MESPLRVAFFCMESEFSVRPLEALLAADVDVALVMRPVGGLLGREETVLRRDRALSRKVRNAGTRWLDHGVRDPFDLARQHQIPCWCVGDGSSRLVIDLMRRERIDLIVVAFFNQLLRPELLDAVPMGAINAHPSLLPDYRGPSPLFWTFRDAIPLTGVTVHKIFPGEDDGDVLAQRAVEIPLGTRGEELVQQLSLVAAEEITRVVVKLRDREALPSRPQEGRGKRAKRPQPEDLELDTQMGARRLFAFARGVGRWNALTFTAGNDRFRVVDAIDFSDEKRVPGEYAQMGDSLLVGCEDGTVVLRVLP